jgi:hypothetical protein
MDLQPPENEALNTAAVLIKYAAENPKTLPETIVLPIANAWKAREDKSWNPDISSKFWTAYSALCDLLKPVTLDTIAASTASIKTHKWILFGPLQAISLTQRTARRYLGLLFVLLAVAILFGFVVSTSNKLSDDIRDQVDKGNDSAVKVMSSLTGIKADLDAIAASNENSLQISLDDPRLKPEVKTRINELRSQLQDLYYRSDMMDQKVRMISRITAVSMIPLPPKGDLSRLPVLDNGFDNVRDYYQRRRSIAASQQNVFFLSSFYSALVPCLLGAIGACTYVLRMMTQQIANFTFSSTSPIRHLVRIALGALAGVAIGLGGIATNSGLSAAALAFVAGYAVEPVFSTLDSIAEKFRSP